MKILTAHLAAISLGLALGVGATPLETAEGVTGILRAAGFEQIREVEQDDGLWEAEVLGADARWYELHVVPGTGEVLDPRSGQPLLDAQQVLTTLQSQGYAGIHSLELDAAIWEADVTAPDGQSMELRVSAFDGHVLTSERDD